MSTYFTKPLIEKALGGALLNVLHFLCAFQKRFFEKKNHCQTPINPLFCTIPVKKKIKV